MQEEEPGAQQAESTGLECLDDACLSAIVACLDAKSLARVQAVDARCRRLAGDSEAWRGVFQADFPQHYAQLSHAAPPPVDHWGSAYNARLRHDRNWASASVGKPAQIQRVHLGVVFGSIFLEGGPFPRGTALTGGVSDLTSLKSALTLWTANPPGAGGGAVLRPTPLRLPASLAGLAGVFDVQQRPGSAQVVCCGFSGDVALLGVPTPEEALPFGEAWDSTGSAALPQPDYAPQPGPSEAAPPHGGSAQAAHLATLAGHTASCPTARCSGEFVATASFDGSVGLWRVPALGGAAGPRPEVITPLAMLRDAAGAEEEEGDAHSRAVDSVSLSADASRVISGGNDMQVKQWDAETGKVVLRLAGCAGWIWCLEALHPSHSVLLSGSTDSTLRTWDLRAGRQVAAVSLSSSAPRVVYPVAGVGLRCDARYAACGCFDGQVHIVDLRAMRCCGALAGHSDRVTRTAVQGDTVLSGGYDGSVALWQL